MTTSENPAIIFSGGIYRDLVAYAERFPKLGETIIGSKFQMGFGGKSANQAVMCSKLGGNALILGMVGNDDNGKAYIENFKAMNVNAKYLGVVDNVSSGVAAIYVDTTTGQNEIIIIPGSNERLTEAFVTKSEAAFLEAKAVVVGLEVALEATISVLTLAHKHGVLTITNAAPARSDLDPRIFELTDVLCVNETEAEIITESANAIESDEDIQIALNKLLEKCPTVIITLGARGSVLATRQSPAAIKVPPSAVDQVVDTTGAGDAFVGALAYYMVNMGHLDLPEIIRRSGYIAGVSVQGEGTQSSFPFKKDLPEELFQ